jgi:uncharacterized membrane protein YjjP (DUF1212 family)
MTRVSAGDRLSLLATVAAVLHTNGQQTSETIRILERVGSHFNGRLVAQLGWDSVILHEPLAIDRESLVIVDATASGVGMNRVVATGQAIERAISQRLTISVLRANVAAAATLPAPSDHTFALAGAAAATALAATFGAGHLPAIALISLSASAGAYARRYVARRGVNAIAQVFLAAMLAGIVGGFGVRWNISSELRLIAVCPCMVLVPGPHFLNGTLDLLAIRIPLGIARLGFAGVVLAAICFGLIAGLTLGGITLPVTPAGRDVSLWLVILAAGIAAASYAVFFSLPLRFVGWPVGVGVLADATRWAAMTLTHAGPALGAGLAALVAGVILVPVSRRHHLPFAGIGFAAIVSLIPGVLAFRIAGGLVALPSASPAEVVPLLEAIALDATSALLIVAAMTIGIVIPKHLYDAVSIMRRDAGAGR